MSVEDDVPSLIEPSSILPAEGDAGTGGTVPLTIICGFLGAGKSTLVKRILTERHGYRIAVIMNEFGDTATINVSSPDDPGAQSEEFLELANGCLCCSIKDSGVAAIEKLMQKKGAFDHILLETTGLADPGPIASMFWQNEELAMGLGRDIHLDGVVCVVDAVFGRKQMEEDHAVDGIGESLRQIAGSDVILLNKVDLSSPEELEITEDMIRGINPVASVYRTVRGQIGLKSILGVDAYASRPFTTASLSQVETFACGGDHQDCGHNHSHGQTHYEMRGISSLQVDCPTLTSTQLARLDEWIRTVLWESHLPEGETTGSGLEILRCKGMFATEDGKTYILQGVRNLYEIAEVEGAAVSAAGVPDLGKVVLIGKGLEEPVRRSFQSLLTL
ncbi:CobW domain-containing protein [Obba rivulosa]|uniref:CobW domain-containing protein n=1 Tax=Obba rivulosa TaxID=1052685 RepID=A0A8E2AX09_9APHY|nr:CobW domain-containing protein [Obba rivulosa]